MRPVVNQMDGFSGRARESRHEDCLFARPAWPDGIDLAPEPLYEQAKAHPLVAAA
jgi:hypothetical protein